MRDWPDHIAEWMALAALVVLAAWLRWPMLDHAYAPDEFANLWHGGLGTAWTLFTDPESGVNPPLLRMLFMLPFDEPTAFWLGRRFCVLASLVAVALAYPVAKRASKGAILVGLVAVLLFAVVPQAVKMAARYRAYAPFSATLMWHLLAQSHWRASAHDGTPDRRWAWHMAVSAALLPWWHYVGVPVLLVLGTVLLIQPATRRGFLLYIPAGVLVAPMALLVFGKTGARVAHREPVAELVTWLVGLRIHVPPRLGQMLELPSVMRQQPAMLPALVIGAVLVLGVVLWRRLSEDARILLVGAVGVIAGVTAMSSVQLVRSPTVIILLCFVAPLIAAIPAHLPTRWAPPLVLAAVLGVLIPPIPDELSYLRATDVYDNVPAFTASFHDYDDVRGDDDIHLYPAWAWVASYFYLTDRYVRYMATDALTGCRERHDGCFAEDDVQFRAIREGSQQAKAEGLVVLFGDPIEGFADHCEPVHDERWLQVYRCEAPPP